MPENGNGKVPEWCLSHRSKAVGLFFALVTAWIFAPIWSDLGASIVGDPRTDAIRGMWGLDHLRHTLLEGQFSTTTRVNFPSGAYALVLPLGTGILGIPLSILLGPIITWNLTLMLVVWATAMGVAWLTKTLTECWLPGILAGSAVIAQPMLHHGLADGTVEHVALWSLPLFIGAAIMALQEQSPRWGVAAGLLSILVAVDSPYNAVYALVTGIIVLPWHLKRVRGRERDLGMSLGAMLLMSAAGAAAVAWLLSPLGLGTGDATAAALQQTNATDIRLWWKYTSALSEVRDPTRPPTLIPTPVLAGAVILSLAGGRKAVPWLVAGLLMVGLSFGLAEKTPGLLGRWLGGPAGTLGDLALGFNTWAYDMPILSAIRFPRRWLVPAVIALSVGASIGLGSLMRRTAHHWKVWTVLTVIAALGTVAHGLQTSRLASDFPAHSVPDVAFADYIAEHPEEGAVLLLPHVRTKAKNATRDELPVFARISPVLASADDLYLQTLHRRAMVSFPSLQTLLPVEHEKGVLRLLRDWSDLSRPKTSGGGIPPSALSTAADHERKAGLRALREAGLRWIAIDLGAYEAQGLAELERQLKVYITDDQSFDDGDGVRVLTLR